AGARTPRVPVVLVTAMGSERVAAEAIHRGVAEYVKKGDGFWEQLPDVVARAARLARSEEQRRRSEAFFALVADNASDLITAADGQGTLTYLSPACRRILGYAPEELLGTAGRELIHPDDREGSILAQSRRDPSTNLVGTLRCRRKDGALIWLEVHSYVARDPHGAPLEFFSICRDVTDRKQAEDSLARERAQLAEAQAVAHVGSWDWDVAADVVSWSDELYRIYGVDKDDF